MEASVVGSASSRPVSAGQASGDARWGMERANDVGDPDAVDGISFNGCEKPTYCSTG